MNLNTTVKISNGSDIYRMLARTRAYTTRKENDLTQPVLKSGLI